MVAGAKLFVSGSLGSGPVGDDVTALVDDWLRFVNTADEDALRDMFTPDGTVTFIAPFGLRREFSGKEQDTIFAEMGRPDLEVVGNPLRRGRFVWFRYDETGSSGVVVFRLSGGRIADQWYVVARNAMGSW